MSDKSNNVTPINNNARLILDEGEIKSLIDSRVEELNKKYTHVISKGKNYIVRIGKDSLYNPYLEFFTVREFRDMLSHKPDVIVGYTFEGAHCIIGSLTDAEQAYVCEGFATGASIYLATGVPVIVAMNADNLKKVVREYKRVMPDLQLLNAADNDAWKPHVGNKGMMTALELHKDLNVRAVYPIFSELDEEQLKSQPTDWNDLHCIAGLKEVTRQVDILPSINEGASTVRMSSASG